MMGERMDFRPSAAAAHAAADRKTVRRPGRSRSILSRLGSRQEADDPGPAVAQPECGVGGTRVAPEIKEELAAAILNIDPTHEEACRYAMEARARAATSREPAPLQIAMGASRRGIRHGAQPRDAETSWPASSSGRSKCGGAGRAAASVAPDRTSQGTAEEARRGPAAPARPVREHRRSRYCLPHSR